MPRIITKLIARNKIVVNSFSPTLYSQYSAVSSLFQKFIHNQKFEFSDSEENIEGISHHTITVDENDKDVNQIASEINSVISSYTQSLFFLTQKSRILRRSENNPNNYLPIQKHEIFNFSLMLDLIKKQWLRPEGGHTCMAMTDHEGAIVEDTQISLRPHEKLILNGKTVLHPHLFGKRSTTGVREARPTMIQQEVNTLSENMLMDKTITAEITVIPIAQSRLQISDVLDNIKSARAIKLYNLCSSIVKKNDISEINDIIIRNYVEELKTRALAIPELQKIVTDESEVVLAALACTHAIIKACYGNTDVLETSIRPDQTTQTAVVYCVMGLIGTKKFRDFAQQINFYDEVSHLTSNRKG